MTKENVITQESFEVLLAWLDHNRETAGQKYEKVRSRLIRIFLGRGCFEAEDLADETINRVTQKLPQLAKTYVGEPMPYFHRVADRIHQEWLRKQKKIYQFQTAPPPQHAGKTAYSPEEDDSEAVDAATEYECLEVCLKALPDDQRELVIEYYRKEKSAKAENRREIAEKLGISVGALQIKVFRLRARLKECMEKCVAKGK